MLDSRWKESLHWSWNYRKQWWQSDCGDNRWKGTKLFFSAPWLRPEQQAPEIACPHFKFSRLFHEIVCEREAPVTDAMSEWHVKSHQWKNSSEVVGKRAPATAQQRLVCEKEAHNQPVLVWPPEVKAQAAAESCGSFHCHTTVLLTFIILAFAHSSDSCEKNWC